METKTWPYGTKRRARVLKANWRPEGLDPRAPAGMLLMDNLDEAHICVGSAADSDAKEGDTGLLTFTQGGPTGGYWQFKKDV